MDPCKALAYKNFRHALQLACQKDEPFIPFDEQELEWMLACPDDLPDVAYLSPYSKWRQGSCAITTESLKRWVNGECEESPNEIGFSKGLDYWIKPK